MSKLSVLKRRESRIRATYARLSKNAEAYARRIVRRGYVLPAERKTMAKLIKQTASVWVKEQVCRELYLKELRHIATKE